MRKLVCGVGINDADYVVQPTVNGKRIHCKFYQTWHSMIRRCYSETYLIRQPTYIGCTVCEEWKSFMNFRKWMLVQDWKSKHLDKDVLVTGNKIYSPKTCMFVSVEINNIFKNDYIKKTNLPAGVSKNELVFRTHVSMSKGVKKYNKVHKTVEKAALDYKFRKCLRILHVAAQQTDIRIRQSLLRIANERYSI